MRNLVLCSAVLAGVSVCWAQAVSPVLLGAGNLSPFPLAIAPGQFLTLFVKPGVIYPRAYLNISAVLSSGPDMPMPVIQVVPANTGCVSAQCPAVLALTVQVPFGIVAICPLCATPALSVASSIVVSVNGVPTPAIAVQPLQDQVHFLTACDVIVGGVNSTVPISGGLPCTPLVTHANGTSVSAQSPAKPGEELVAYATGLGDTNPSPTAGQPVAKSSATLTTFGIDFNFRANVLATKPGAVGAPDSSPLFTGSTQGYIGLYQINFVVPRPPAGLQPCVDFAIAPGFAQAAQSNLTVSVGSAYSFDGAGICVTP